MSESQLIKVEAEATRLPDHFRMGWQAVATAPFDRDLELAVIDAEGPHALVFPCRRVGNSWIDAKLRRPVEVYPTHWQDWAQDKSRN